MPVILEPENYELWLDPGFRDLDTLTGMLKPFDPAQMKCHAVSALVNSPANDDPECALETQVVDPTQGRVELSFQTSLFKEGKTS